MFKKTLKAGGISPHSATLISQGTEVMGDLVFDSELRIEGCVKGNIVVIDESVSEATVIVGELGVVEGDVNVPNIILNGTVLGNVVAIGRLELGPQAKVTGTVSYKLIEMSMGAEINGQLIHLRDDSLNELMAAISDEIGAPELTEMEEKTLLVNS